MDGTKACRVCKQNNLKGKQETCDECYPFYQRAYLIIEDEGRKEVDQTDFPIIEDFAKYLKDLYYIDQKVDGVVGVCAHSGKQMLLRRRDIVFTGVEKDDIEQYGFSNRMLKLYGFSVDRILNNDPYKKGNIKLCTVIQNIMKNALDESEVSNEIIEYLQSQIKNGKHQTLLPVLKSLVEFAEHYEPVDSNFIQELFKETT